MLSRTADNLYWLSRYTERADFVARILDATLRLAALPSSYGGERNEWEGAVAVGGGPRRVPAALCTSRTRTRSATSSPSARNNPSSIRNCIETARENARSVRTALTTEMWEAINGAWLELKRFDKTAMSRGGVRALPRLGEGRLARLRRLGLPDDAAQRRLLVHPARRCDRAGRQHRPHPRRQVPSAAARRPSGSAAASTTSSGRPSCARSRRSPPTTGSTGRASSPGSSPIS